MSGPPALGRLLESFFRDRLTQQRNASPATIASYRDALRLLVLFAAERTGRKPAALAVQDLDRHLVLAYLDHLEHERGNAIPHPQCPADGGAVIFPACGLERSGINRHCPTDPGHPHQAREHRGALCPAAR